MDGIAWNQKVSDPVTSVKQLFEDPQLKGRVGVWNSMGDTLGLVMLENGDDPAKVTDASFNRAIARVQKAVGSGQILKFYGNDYGPPLAKGDLKATMAWSGDIANLADPNLHWVVTPQGGIIWTDNMIIPLGGSVPTASTYMNFMYGPAISAQWALGANYISSVTGVKQEAVKLDPNASSNDLTFPSDKTLSQMHQNDPAMLTNPNYNKKWLAVTLQ
jgi:spermidine/putrescine transport system substrate-binding protein